MDGRVSGDLFITGHPGKTASMPGSGDAAMNSPLDQATTQSTIGLEIL
jgi:hypothetical protein